MSEIVATRKRIKKRGIGLKKPTREPDIAFWFDEVEDTLYMVRIKDGIKHIQLVQACFDLLARAIRSDEDTVIGELEE